MTRFRMLADRLREWRTDTWPLLPWRDTPSAYRRRFVLHAVAKAVAVAAAWAWTRPSLELDDGTVLAAALATALVTGALIQRSSNVIMRFDTAPSFALAVSLHPIAAALCATAGRIGSAIRKPLPLHLALVNVFDPLCTIAFVVCAVDAVASVSRVLDPLWVLAAIGSVVAAEALTSTSQHLLQIAAGYCPSRAIAARSLANEVRSFAISEAPLVTVVGAAIALGHPIALLFLLVPRLVSYDVGKHSDMLVDAKEEAAIDTLTGLPNRRSFIAHAALVVDDASSAGDSWLIMCDLDNFKQVNDRHGHATGDHTLVQAAEAMTHAVAGSGTVARLGGDEFIVTVEHRPSPDDVRGICQTIIDAIDSSIGFLGVSVSVGVHRIQPTDDPSTALHHADIAMYVAKQSAATRVVFSHEVRDRSRIGEQPPTDLAATDTIVEEHEADLHLTATTSAERRRRAREYWTELADRHRASGDRHELAKALYQRYWASEADAEAMQLLDTAAAIGTEDVGWAARAAAARATRSGDRAEAERLDRRALRIAQRRGDTLLEIVALAALSYDAIQLGEFDAAVDLAGRAKRLAVLHRCRSWVPTLASRLVDALTLALRADEAVDAARDVAEAADRRGSPDDAVRARAIWMETLLASGSVASALSGFDSPSDDPRLAAAQARALIAGGLLDEAGTQIAACEHGAVDDIDRRRIEYARARLLDARGHTDAAEEVVLATLPAEVDRWAVGADLDAACWLAHRFARRGWQLPPEIVDRSKLDAVRTTAPLARSMTEQLLALKDRDPRRLLDLSGELRAGGRLLDAARCRVSSATIGAPGASLGEVVDALVMSYMELSQSGAVADAGTVAETLAEVAPVRWAGVRTIDSPLFADLDAADIAQVRRYLAPRTIDPRETVFAEGARLDGLCIVGAGSVRLIKHRRDRALVLATAGVGDVFGEAALSADPRAGTHAEAIETTVVYTIAREAFEQMTARWPSIGNRLATMLEARARESQHLAERLAHSSVAERVRQLLLDLDDRFGTDGPDGTRVIDQGLSQGDLATMAGMTRQTMAASLRQLRTAGAIEVRHRRIVIRDRALLEAPNPADRAA